MKKALSFAVLICILFIIPSAFFSCSNAADLYSEGEGDLKVVCTVFATFDFVRSIGGEHITATLLQSNGSDLHSYTPTASALKAVGEADIFIYVGGEADSVWAEELITAAENPALKIIKLSDCVDDFAISETSCDWKDHSHNHTGTFDEHFWTSLTKSISIVNSLSEAISSADSENSEKYEINRKDYTQKLEKLHSDYASVFQNAESDIVVFADRFPFVYLFKDYKFPYLAAFGGCSSETNASYETLAIICDTVTSKNLSSVLTVDGSDEKLASSVKAQTGCDILKVNSLQSVTRTDIERGLNYIDVMTQNLEAFRIALGSK